MTSTHGTRIAFGGALMCAFIAIVALDVFLDTDYGLGGLGILIGTAGLLEFYDLAAKKGFNPFRRSGIVGGVLIFVSCWSDARVGGNISLNIPILFVFVCWLFLWQGIGRDMKHILENVSITVFGVLYVFFFLSFSMAILHLPGVNGLVVLFGIILMAKCTDIGAYFVGKELGSHKLFPAISPNKTLEGAVGGLASCVLVAVGWNMLPQFSVLPLVWAVVFGLFIGVVAVGGDLMVSMLKRDAGVKDSGNLVPSFGGVLDIIDCIVVSLPAGYYFLKFCGGNM
ncbi:MAG: phosphatidate cytidylyltransferase [Planctomycetes bacterium]|nr:phosphatidate cytidylyltransferase [Planctomycetota bacterium]